MALTSALFTGLSGLNVNQTRLNVVGNNIANVNTIAFKSSRALFKPQFYVTDGGGSPPNDEFGGTNPSQRGLGASVASIEKNFEPGSIEPTGRREDMAIDGSGFFIVQGPDTQKFTRDGSFTLNSSNQLVTTAGDFVQGFGVDDDFNILPGTLKNIMIPLGTSTSAKATEDVVLEGNLNSDGTVASGASILLSQPIQTISAAPISGATTLVDLASVSAPATPLFTGGETITLVGKKGGRDLPAATLAVTAATTVADLQSFLQQGLGIDTTVPPTVLNPSQTITPGVNIQTIGGQNYLTITGNTGEENALAMNGTAFTVGNGASPFTFVEGTDNQGIASGATGESVHTSFTAYDSLGTPITLDVTAVLESKADTGNTWRFYVSSGDDTDTNLSVGAGTITFDNEGKIKSSTGGTVQMDRANTGAKTPLVMTLDFSKMTSLTSRTSDMVMTQQDGSPIGTLSSYSIGSDGTITGSFTNGLTRTLGQMALASFNNPQGLVDIGGNMYTTGGNSGIPVISSPLSLGAGSVRSGALELSNVDISEEFTNLIIATTGFTASSRVISTSDQLLTELLNSSR